LTIEKNTILKDNLTAANFSSKNYNFNKRFNEILKAKNNSLISNENFLVKNYTYLPEAGLVNEESEILVLNKLFETLSIIKKA
jgi:hypothetical protein